MFNGRAEATTRALCSAPYMCPLKVVRDCLVSAQVGGLNDITNSHDCEL